MGFILVHIFIARSCLSTWIGYKKMDKNEIHSKVVLHLDKFLIDKTIIGFVPL